MRIEPVTAKNLDAAASIHAISWQESHRHFCSEDFVRAHTPQRQKQFIERQMQAGRQFFILYDGSAKGIVSVWACWIENLYVLPSEQRKGYGTELLRFAETKCSGCPSLWVLSNNQAALSLYKKRGYALTGSVKKLNDSLQELEMRLL